MKLKMPRGTFSTADGQFFEAKRLLTVGRSRALTISKVWADLMVPSGWVGIETTGNKLIIRELDNAELEAIETWLSMSSGKQSS
jgi:hypothetical protein